MRSAVDLPQPDGPSSDTNSPLAHGEIEAVERHDAVGECLADAVQRNDGGAGGIGFGHALLLRPQIERRRPC